MRVVAETSETELAFREAEVDLSQATRELAANLIRVIRGAGRPYGIEGEAAKLVEAAARFWAIEHGQHRTRFPTEVIARVLNGEGMPSRPINQPFDDFDHATERMISGALRVVAARLLGQKLQVTAGMKELMDAFYHLERVREARRVAYQDANRIVTRSRPKKQS